VQLLQQLRKKMKDQEILCLSFFGRKNQLSYVDLGGELKNPLPVKEAQKKSSNRKSRLKQNKPP